VPGHTLRPGPAPGIYIELDENGVPLGEWHWDDDAQEWIFDEYPPPLANLPQTGGKLGLSSELPGLLLIFLVFLFLCPACTLIALRPTHRRRRKDM
jgi:hypothetical protein